MDSVPDPITFRNIFRVELGIEPGTSCIGVRHANHYINEVVRYFITTIIIYKIYELLFEKIKQILKIRKISIQIINKESRNFLIINNTTSLPLLE